MKTIHQEIYDKVYLEEYQRLFRYIDNSTNGKVWFLIYSSSWRQLIRRTAFNPKKIEI